MAGSVRPFWVLWMSEEFAGRLWRLLQRWS